ncbi:MAG: hypothetical protein Q9165_006916 [Trypethelium subeluteriae]
MNGGDRPERDSDHDLNPPSTDDAQDRATTNHPISDTTETAIISSDNGQNGFVGPSQPDLAAPQVKKRKLFEPEDRPRSASRAVSPPWKKVAAEGPSSFVEDGRRKSSRVNVVPIDLQPQGKKRQTRLAQQKSVAEKLQQQRSGSKGNPHSNSTVRNATSKGALPAGNPPATTASPAKRLLSYSDPKRSPANSSSPVKIRSDGQEDRRFKRARVERAPSPTPAPRRHSGRVAKQQNASNISNAIAGPSSTSVVPVSPPQIYKLRLKIRTPAVPILHPGGMPPRKKFDTLEDWLQAAQKGGHDPEDAWIGDEKATTKWVKREAKSRLDILEASQPGGLLSKEKCSVYAPEAQDEPVRPPGHFDYVIAHALNFQGLLKKERREHKAVAKRLAYAAAAVWKAKQPKTEEEIVQEQRNVNLLVYKQLMRDLQQKWLLVASEINKERRLRWEEEQQKLANENLDQILDHSTKLLDHRRLRNMSGSSDADDMTESGDDEQSEDDDEIDDDKSGEAEWQAIPDDTISPHQHKPSKLGTYGKAVSLDNDVVDEEEDDQLSAEQLKWKYAKLLESSKSLRQSVEAAMESSEHEEDGEADDAEVEDGVEDGDEDRDGSDEDAVGYNEEKQDDARNDDAAESDAGIEATLEGHPVLDQKATTEQPDGETNDIEDVGEKDQSLSRPAQTVINPVETSQTMQSVDKFRARNDDIENYEMRDIELEDVDETMLDDSDESTDMDDEDMSSDEEEDSEEESSEEEDEDEDAGTSRGLLGFLSKKEINAATIGGVQEPFEEAAELPLEGTEHSLRAFASGAETQTNGVRHEIHSDDIQQVDMISADATSPASPATSTTAKPSEADSASSVVPSAESKRQSPEPATKVLTKPSSLLRGTLREYQHEGLDWLAKLYADRTNGILADEMGLGKTIQAISLLAHLATEHEVWGPHLVVVPTSVMLNWEVEFKKFLPGFKILVYYGTAEERKAKRQGWSNPNRYNVVITSYQLILQDHQAFRIRSWHYLILDEAHNIKNFNSQRWQVLLRFKSQARLLLTGTPLQNNLTELWSLLWFITPGGAGMSTLDEFSRNFKLPAEQIFDKGNSILDSRAKEVVGKLHHMLRPYLLRRLKSEVEKQMPAKYEHVVYCRLSKRQRQLYDGFMSRADTKQTLASGNYMSIINCLMSLRKVCNHPDLFETRQIVTSFAMPKSAVASYEIKELMVRKRLLDDDPLEKVDVQLFGSEELARIDASRTRHLSAAKTLQDLADRQKKRLTSSRKSSDSATESALSHLNAVARESRLSHLQHCASVSYDRIKKIPLQGTDLTAILTFKRSHLPEKFAAPRSGRLNTSGSYGISSFRFQGSRSFKAAEFAKASRHRVRPELKGTMTERYLNSCQLLDDLTPTLDQRAQEMESTIQKFGCITPSVVANDLLPLALGRHGVQKATNLNAVKKSDPFHEARIRMSIAFPDKRLLQYDCGKLQQLDKLLRKLQAEGHRALIFTQMTRVLDILEQFLNIHGHRYLRLDGSTRIELRQALTERFNSDERILAFILSSRSGGLGINLTGADTVIFYDLDWNPAMDKQCQDRCHRIGQTRDVHIYRFVSEYTIEANILRKSNQKRLLDNVVIQEGEFNTDYFNKLGYRDVLDDGAAAIGEDDEAGAAMDKVFGGGEATVGKVLESVEDTEDVQAAQNAKKEEVQTDVADFAESGSGTQAKLTPKSSVPPTPGDANHQAEEAGGVQDGGFVEDEVPHVDTYMLRFVDWELSNIPVAHPAPKPKKKGKSTK